MNYEIIVNAMKIGKRYRIHEITKLVFGKTYRTQTTEYSGVIHKLRTLRRYGQVRREGAFTVHYVRLY